MIVNMCEEIRKKIIFGRQFVKATHNLTFTVIQPRRMFNKMCYAWCAGVHYIGMFLYYMPCVCFSRDTVIWDTEERLFVVSGTSASLNQEWTT